MTKLLIIETDDESSDDVVAELAHRGFQVEQAAIGPMGLGRPAGRDAIIVDRVAHPFTLGELVTRLEALLRRPAESPVTTLRAGPLALDLIERTARRGDRPLELLPREFRLLEYMIRHEGQIVTRATLFEEVWNYRFAPSTNLVDVHMGRLRRKVDGPAEAPMIHSVRGAGFVLRAPT